MATSNLTLLKTAFSSAADVNKALEMARYMKNHFAFFGIPKPQRSEMEKSFISVHSKNTYTELKQTLLALWEDPHREMQYTGLNLMIKSKLWEHEDSILLFEQLIQHKSWWDTVDLIAGRCVGPYFLQFPQHRKIWIEKWLRSNNIWLNRTAMLFQLNYKKQTDEALLFHCAVSLSDSKEFFIQKAIGWALRQYARTAPESVWQFVMNHNLKPLSRREALKHFSK
jgi:3-methyladenine DNA glycosylase AlkD